MKCIPYLCAVAGIVWLDLWVYGGALRSHWPIDVYKRQLLRKGTLCQAA